MARSRSTGDVLLDANVVINSGTAATKFGGAIDSSCAGECTLVPVDLSASASALSFGGAIGGVNALADLSPDLGLKHDVAVGYSGD